MAPRKKAAETAADQMTETPLAELSVEAMFEELDRIMEQLEASDTTLEEAFAKYEAGMKLVKACNDKIDHVEKQIRVLRGGENTDGHA